MKPRNSIEHLLARLGGDEITFFPSSFGLLGVLPVLEDFSQRVGKPLSTITPQQLPLYFDLHSLKEGFRAEVVHVNGYCTLQLYGGEDLVASIKIPYGKKVPQEIMGGI